MRKVIFVTVLLTAVIAVTGQTPKTKEVEVMKYSDDHKTIESIVNATYEVISGEKGVARDWDRFRALFHPSGKLIPTGNGIATALNPDDYINRSESFLVGQGFFEEEISSKVERFGSVAHVFSTYEARRSKSDEKPFMRGINSFQLFHDGNRWWILSILWQQESENSPIPGKYLP